MIHFIILAAGKSERFKKKKNKISKQFYKFRGISPLEHLITSVSNSPSINSITLVINKDDKEEIKGFKMKYPKLNTVVSGGNTRQKSVFIALKNIRKKRIKTRNDIVLIHDAARPFLENRIIENCILNLKKYDGVFPALNTDDTLRNKKNLNIVAEKNQILFNQYGITMVNPMRCPNVNVRNAKIFINWLLSEKGQNSISNFKIKNQQLFFPNRN